MNNLIFVSNSVCLSLFLSDLKEQNEEKPLQNSIVKSASQTQTQMLPVINKKSITNASLKTKIMNSAESLTTFRIPTVTASQGLKDGTSLFVGHSGKQSILDMSISISSQIRSRLIKLPVN